jgi:hypothetical protein
MSTLTHLSDAELDAVTGGFAVFNTAILSFNSQKNVNLTSQGQTNVAVLAIAKQGGTQINQTEQSNSIG